jgi:hypothetical protein
MSAAADDEDGDDMRLRRADRPGGGERMRLPVALARGAPKG